LIRSWSQATPSSVGDVHAELVRVAGMPDLRRARRALPFVLAAIPPVFIIAFTVLIIAPTVTRFFGPETNEMLAFLEMLYNPKPQPDSRLADPNVRTAIETYIAGRHGTRLRDAGFWNAPVMRGVSTRLRKTAEGVAARHPSVSSEELAQATTTIAPELERRRQRRGETFADISGIIILATVAMALIVLLLLGIVSSLIVPGGLFTRMLGHAVVHRDGREIGRMFSLARVLVAWAPAIAWLLYLAASPKVQGFVPTPPNPLAGTLLTLGVLAAGAIFTIARPSRGPHDWLLGTWVVPR
jgi:RDD family